MIGPVHEVFRLFCHQLPDRSPQNFGLVFPVCYRCAGFYAGFVAQLIYLVARNTWKGGLPDVRTTVCAALPAGVAYIDGVGNFFGLWNSPDWLRAASGAGAGLLIPLILLPLLPIPRTAGAARIAANPGALLPPAALAGLLLVSIAYPWSPVEFELLALIPAIALVAMLAGVAWLFGSVKRTGHNRIIPDSFRS